MRTPETVSYNNEPALFKEMRECVKRAHSIESKRATLKDLFEKLLLHPGTVDESFDKIFQQATDAPGEVKRAVKATESAVWSAPERQPSDLMKKLGVIGVMMSAAPRLLEAEDVILRENHAIQGYFGKPVSITRPEEYKITSVESPNSLGWIERPSYKSSSGGGDPRPFLLDDNGRILGFIDDISARENGSLTLSNCYVDGYDLELEMYYDRIDVSNIFDFRLQPLQGSYSNIMPKIAVELYPSDAGEYIGS